MHCTRPFKPYLIWIIKEAAPHIAKHRNCEPAQLRERGHRITAEETEEFKPWIKKTKWAMSCGASVHRASSHAN